MSIADHDGKIQVSYTKETCFTACKETCKSLDGFSVEKIDEISATIYLKGNMSLFSWGEYVSISVKKIEPSTSEINIISAPKIGLGANAPGLMGDMGKNRKNIIKIQQAITESLSKYPPESNLISGGLSIADEIKKLGELKYNGLLTEQEFSERKVKLLNNL